MKRGLKPNCLLRNLLGRAAPLGKKSTQTHRHVLLLWDVTRERQLAAGGDEIVVGSSRQGRGCCASSGATLTACALQPASSLFSYFEKIVSIDCFPECSQSQPRVATRNSPGHKLYNHRILPLCSEGTIVKRGEIKLVLRLTPDTQDKENRG